jgi:hypothetical protein
LLEYPEQLASIVRKAVIVGEERFGQKKDAGCRCGQRMPNAPELTLRLLMNVPASSRVNLMPTGAGGRP